jgi:hypothetical protein
MMWEEYVGEVFKHGVRLRATDKKSAWDRIRLCFDFFCDGVPAPEARSLMGKSKRKSKASAFYQMLDRN